MIGTYFQSHPGILLSIDETVSKDEYSDRKLSPDDLRGKSIGMDLHSTFILEAIMQKHEIQPGEVKIIRTGNDPGLILTGRIDAMGGFLVNQPRALEELGHKNWMGTPYSELLHEEYGNIAVVKEEMTLKQGGVLRRFLWAMKKSIHFLLDHPQEAMEITHASLPNNILRPDQTLWRFEKERPLIMPMGRDGIMKMDPVVLDTITADLIMYGLIDEPSM